MRVAEAMAAEADVTLLGVAGRHSHVPSEPWSPAIPIAHLPVGGPLLYDLWLRRNWPKVERATGSDRRRPCDDADPVRDRRADGRHRARPGVPARSIAVHPARQQHLPAQPRSDPASRRPRAVQQPGDDGRLRRRRACRPIACGWCRSVSTSAKVDADEIARVAPLYRLPQRYLLFVGTVEPRKNLRGLVEAVSRLDEPLPLVVAGAEGWGDVDIPPGGDVRFIGFVPAADLAGLYAGAEVFCYPSEREGYGLPVLEAMAQGTPVVTSRGTATEEAAGGAAVLVDPLDPDDIARGITEAAARREALSADGVARADQATWQETARLTAAAYRELC